jgi:predicted phage-related endonuclease
MALTAQQLADRHGKLTGSRVACLMTGDAEKIMQLWLEMTGQAMEENLDHVWPVQLGSATEELNLRWFEMKNGALSRYGEVVTHPYFKWAAATLDAWWNDGAMPVECKHVGGREPLETIIERYQPQMQWQMAVTDANECAISVIMGANEPVIEFIPRDRDYIHEMIRRGEQFMEHVANRTPPVALVPVAAPIDATKVYDFTGSNAWSDHAATWLETRDAADKCKQAEKSLKAIVPDDAKKCTGHGIQITRDRAGRLSLRQVQ